MRSLSEYNSYRTLGTILVQFCQQYSYGLGMTRNRLDADLLFHSSINIFFIFCNKYSRIKKREEIKCACKCGCYISVLGGTLHDFIKSRRKSRDNLSEPVSILNISLLN